MHPPRSVFVAEVAASVPHDRLSQLASGVEWSGVEWSGAEWNSIV